MILHIQQQIDKVNSLTLQSFRETSPIYCHSSAEKCPRLWLPVNPRPGSSPCSTRWRTIAGLDELSRVRWCWNGSRSPCCRDSRARLSRLSRSLETGFIPHRLRICFDGEKRSCRWFYSCNNNSANTQRCSPSAIITYNSASHTEHARWRKGWERVFLRARALHCRISLPDPCLISRLG